MSNLNEKAMLVLLNVSQWTARKYDKRATKQVADNNQATGDVGKFNKLLIQGDDFRRIGQIVNQARDYHYKHTLPWDNNGQRILPIVGFDSYRQGMNGYMADFNSAVSNFVAKYPELKNMAQRVLGSLYRADDYPVDVAQRFNFSVELMPVPDSGDFRVALGEDEIADISAKIECKVKSAESKAKREIADRIHKALSHAVNKLQDVEEIFRDSLIGNIKELSETLPLLNMDNDPVITQLAEDLRDKIGNKLPSELRNYPERRIQVANDAKALLDDIDKRLGLA